MHTDFDKLERIAAYLQAEGFKLARAYVHGCDQVGKQLIGFNKARQIVQNTWQAEIEAIA